MSDWTGIRVRKADFDSFKKYLLDTYGLKYWYYGTTGFKDQPYHYMFQGGPPPTEWSYTLEREIIWRMITGRRYFQFATTKELETHIAVRKRIVKIAKELGESGPTNSALAWVGDSSAWPNEDWEYVPTDDVDERGKQVVDLWDFCGEERIRSAKAGRSRILDELFEGKHRIAVGCKWAMRLIILRGIELESLELFKRRLEVSESKAKMGFGLLKNCTRIDTLEKREKADRGGWDWVPGDGGWIQNLTPPPESVDPKGEFVGENIIYLGGSFDYPLGWATDSEHEFLYSSKTKSKFFGWPGGNKTMNEWCLEISGWPSGGDPDVHVSRISPRTQT